MQRREAPLVGGHDAGALLDEKLCDRIIAGQDREDQGRLTVCPALIDLGAFGQERLDSRKITLACRIVERPR